MVLFSKMFICVRQQLLFKSIYEQCGLAGCWFRWPGLAPAGDLLSCTRKKGGKEGVLRSLGTAELTARLRRCVRTTAVSQTGCAGCAEGGCALTDTLLCGGALRLLRSFSGCVEGGE